MPVYRATVHVDFPTGSKHGTNTWHFRTTAVPVPGPNSLSDIVHDFYDAMKAYYGTPYVWTFDGILAEVGNPDPADPPAVSAWTVTGSGSSGATSGAAGVGLVVGWRTALANRRGRGRTFLTPLPGAAFQSDGTLTDTFLSDQRAAAAQLVSDSTADGNGALVVWSQVDSVARDIIGFKVNDRVAWLSSRRG